MAIILFVFWLILNGQWTTEIAVVGAVLCSLIYLFIWKFLDFSPRSELRMVKRLGRVLAYIGWLVTEILRSAVATVRLVWSPKLETEPKLVQLKSRLKTESGRVVLADSITLTPGTVTVSIQENNLLVHCLDADFADGLTDSEMERRLLALEEGKHRA